MSLLHAPIRLTGGGVYDGEVSDSEWIYHSTARCWRCGKQFGQTLRLPKVGALEQKRPSPEDIEDAMLQAMHRNHKCSRLVH